MKFESLEQVQAWLKTQDTRVSEAIAARAAIRLLPAAMPISDARFDTSDKESFLLAFSRAALTSSVVSALGITEKTRLQKAADSAKSAVRFYGSATETAITAACANKSTEQQIYTLVTSVYSMSKDRTSAEKSTQAAVANDAVKLLTTKPQEVFTSPLWPKDGEVENLTVSCKMFETRPDPDGTWSFWRRWYHGMLEGQPVDWDLQLQVALIDDAIWEEGPEAIARAIREIERELAGPAPLEDAVLRKHIEHLLKNSILSEATALNGAETIERAISDYLREAPANCLPENLKHLEALPHHFRAIARVIGSQTSKAAKEPKLADEISKLHARVAELEKKLAAAKSKELKGVISLKAAESFGKTIGSPVFWSGSAMSVAYFFGVSPSDMTFENLREYVGELWRANSEAPVPSNPSLPSSLEV